MRFEPILRPLYRAAARRTRAMTLGVRGLVTDAEGRVLLIRHTYVKGWYMPGGGVERGETAEEALERELLEEAGVRMTGRARLLSFHSNHVRFPGDHVLIYRVEAWEATTPTQTGEIAEIAWFAPDALPDGVTPSTRRRIEEALDGEAPHPHW
ncbi:NUDIX domain-containing protein [Caulobacter sp. KR2-114]|uniref:NUDIX domain-containing protein n=1 Tax=Caulobacter sp. KR2-114 TaxID=3400912 RepID=UPI003C079022